MSHASKRIQAAVAAELAALFRKHAGLRPAAVVRWAKAHPRSALHGKFTWNDGEAAHRYRLWQAQHLIADVEVEYPDGKIRRVYVSPVRERRTTGYATLADVMSDRARREEFFAQALAEYERVGEKYRDLAELAEVRESVKRARQRARNGRKAA